MLYDNYGRPTLNLRISLTQRCNLHCVYCHREGQVQSSVLSEMTTEEVLRIATIAVSLGISRIKLTGGEPLLRSDIVDIVHGLAMIPGLLDLSMTTNGIRLPGLATLLHDAGLMRVNINLPSLEARTYMMLNGGNLKNALKGIDEAVKAGLYPVKLNMLILRGINVKDVPKMIEFATRSKTVLQLIELEPVNVKDAFYLQYYFSLDSIEKEIRKQALSVKTRCDMQNRHIYALSNVQIEVVHPIENTEFCARCTRVRITSDGHLKPCLMRNNNLVDLLTPMRKGISDDELKQIFIKTIEHREPYYKPLKAIGV